jgi:hypothetical protein
MSEYAAQEREYRTQTLARAAREYLDLRVAHLYRARPSLQGRIEDLIHQLSENLRNTVLSKRSFGPDRIPVVDILFSDDHAKRRALLQPTDQSTIVNEIVEKSEAGAAKTATTSHINSVRTLYAHLDPPLEMVVETLQTFQWLDLPDAIDAANVEAARNYLSQIIKAQGVPEPLRESFNRSINRPEAQAVELEEVMLLFFHRMQANAQKFAERRKDEPAHVVALCREPAANLNEEINALLLACGNRLRGAAQLQAAGQLSPEQREAAARAMDTEPGEASLESVLAFEAAQLAKDKKRLADKLQAQNVGGKPFDYKRRQMAIFEEKLAAMAEQLSSIGVDLSKEPPKPRARED